MGVERLPIGHHRCFAREDDHEKVWNTNSKASPPTYVCDPLQLTVRTKGDLRGLAKEGVLDPTTQLSGVLNHCQRGEYPAHVAKTGESHLSVRPRPNLRLDVVKDR
jgi:hypothetical protein